MYRRPPSLPALPSRIAQKSRSRSISKMGRSAFKVILLEVSAPELVAPNFRKSRSRARHPQKSKFSYSRIAFPLETIALFCVFIVFISSKIALPCGVSSKFRRFIFVKLYQNDAPVQSIRTILIIYENDVEEVYTKAIPNESRCTKERSAPV